MTENRRPYPVRVDGTLDGSLSRGLWLVKWLLLIPHYIVLAFLWLAFVALSVVAFFAILVTGRYPRALFDFNVGVLRWTWRVNYYGYGALGTDRYPPFSLADDPGYPARFDVTYPERLSRGLVLVKSWLLAIPHYLVVGIFVGGGLWFAGGSERWNDGWAAGGLVALLVLVAGLVLLVTGRYPAPVYDFVLGMDRWALRVAAYAGLMTDEYPPFRLDMGGPDPGSLPLGPPPAPPVMTGAVPEGTPSGPGATSAAVGPVDQGRPPGWTGGRVVSVVIGAILLFTATGFLLGGGGLLWADQTQRDGDYLWSPTATISTGSYALTSDSILFDVGGAQWVIDQFLGTARLQVTPRHGETGLFVGVARTAEVEAYLAGVGHDQISDIGPRWDGPGVMEPGTITRFRGGAPDVAPGDTDIWTESSSGPGVRTLDWRPADGDWTVVVMRADGGQGVSADIRAAATAPGLTWLAAGLLATGVVLAAIGALLVALGVHRAQQGPPPGYQPAQPLPVPPPAPGGERPLTPAPGPPR